MFVDIVSSEYDRESFEEFENVIGKLNHHDVRQLDADFACGKVLEFSQKGKSNSLSQRDIKPMLHSCSAGYKQNPDGSWEITTEVVFTNSEPSKDEGSQSSNENSSSQETNTSDTDPPASNDENKG